MNQKDEQAQGSALSDRLGADEYPTIESLDERVDALECKDANSRDAFIGYLEKRKLALQEESQAITLLIYDLTSA